MKFSINLVVFKKLLADFVDCEYTYFLIIMNRLHKIVILYCFGLDSILWIFHQQSRRVQTTSTTKSKFSITNTTFASSS